MRRTGLCLLLMAVLVGACRPDEAVLTGADEGTSVDLQPGERVTVRLDSNATTGYAWNLAVELDKNVVRLVSSDYEVVDEGTEGGGGVETWVFEAVRAGDQTVQLDYSFQDEPERTTQEFTFHVVVREDT